ncbi:MAG: FecR domain-containing protein [Verrucomicrobiaceae bacterium]|nr:FecR domain-containing protein [Verrucomicrobiaceae bacterium]
MNHKMRCAAALLLVGVPAVHAQQAVPVKSVTALSALGEMRTSGRVSTRELPSSVILSGVGTARMEPRTEIRVPGTADQDQSLQLLKGRLYLNIDANDLKKRAGGEFRLKTPAALLAVKGTEFFVDAGEGGDTVGVSAGSVLVESDADKATLLLKAGQAATVRPQGISAPRSLTAEERGQSDKIPLPAADPSVIQGRVLDQNRRPVVGAMVELRSGDDYFKPMVTVETTVTKRGGIFALKKTEAGKKLNSVRVPSFRGFKQTDKRLTLMNGETPQLEIIVYLPQVVTFDYVFQPDGSRSFANASTTKGRLTLRGEVSHIDFAKALATRSLDSVGHMMDIDLSYDEGMCGFRASGVSNGFFDAGATSLDLVPMAAENGYDTSTKPCVAGHTYVVRTYEGKYAKFRVTSMKADDGRAK